ncbi:gfo/Idh/MocA family oxidoreductase [Alginatibacterium sediminis]|uniref:Gfo/Idh/MocA family oxidoreductase n=1 Tax=Alginatibacterium sediminis TaxID=2164068 RepID=A0A420EAV9_9ALTE|nr:Gfo/Idh/MocA family oxidoreductase [Alginatibacterium sediminis]RKF17815.1 gfo/Idh/MocA family oxidoreductase [Alginatibacterium sediminis]
MILLIGAGPMAQEYAKVLQAQKQSFRVIGRSQASADEFELASGQTVYVGGLKNFCNSNELANYSKAIVTTGVEQLAETTRLLIENGVKQLLIEKPGGIDAKQIDALTSFAQEHAAEVFVAYNRRFYASVQKAIEIIEQDGGVQSFNFELTEWGHVIAGIPKAEGVKENWFMGNTTHVVDLAFFLGGFPKQLSSFTTGCTPWHSRSSNFAGAGISDSGALFAYHGNWGAPGRWSVEILTSQHRLIFRPMEQLQIQSIGSVAQEFTKIDDQIDKDYKAGLYKQVESFLRNEKQNLCTLAAQNENAKVYSKIAGYS